MWQVYAIIVRDIIAERRREADARRAITSRYAAPSRASYPEVGSRPTLTPSSALGTHR